ncbi:MAG: hypothetical protein AAF611_21770 [Bacteroidota bacterium]
MEEKLQNDIQDLKNQVNQLHQKLENVQTETEKAKKTASRAETAARDNNGTIWFVGLIIMALLAFTTNPSFKAHEEHLAQKNIYINGYEAKQAYGSYFIFSTISSLSSDPEEKMITFGIFGNVFTINNPSN